MLMVANVVIIIMVIP